MPATLKPEDFFPYFLKEIYFEDNRSKTMPFRGRGTLIGIRETSVEIRVGNVMTNWYDINSLNIYFHIIKK
jgi:hypothetical protein